MIVAVQVHDENAEIPVGQIEWVADGTLDAIDHHLTATPKDPQRNLPLLGERNFSEERQREQPKASPARIRLPITTGAGRPTASPSRCCPNCATKECRFRREPGYSGG